MLGLGLFFLFGFSLPLLLIVLGLMMLFGYTGAPGSAKLRMMTLRPKSRSTIVSSRRGQTMNEQRAN